MSSLRKATTEATKAIFDQKQKKPPDPPDLKASITNESMLGNHDSSREEKLENGVEKSKLIQIQKKEKKLETWAGLFNRVRREEEWKSSTGLKEKIGNIQANARGSVFINDKDIQRVSLRDGLRRSMGDEKKTSIWDDPWLGSIPLCKWLTFLNVEELQKFEKSLRSASLPCSCIGDRLLQLELRMYSSDFLLRQFTVQEELTLQWNEIKWDPQRTRRRRQQCGGSVSSSGLIVGREKRRRGSVARMSTNFAAAMAMAVVVAVLTGSAAQTTPSCASNLYGCAQFINSTETPPQSCCGPLKEAAKNDLPCLCGLFNNTVILKAFNVNITQAIQMAKRCGVSTDQTACQTAAAAPTINSTAPSSSSNTPACFGVTQVAANASGNNNSLRGNRALKIHIVKIWGKTTCVEKMPFSKNQGIHLSEKPSVLQQLVDNVVFLI
ncbi:lipid transfer-like protein VAS isoform X3 [Canna indica]|uniref:Lipid transfer-like protein VAS isoform X3 n=1 Tax=Canna indica TaxID=4628 RepID=A0AAQ3L271_9LILI|nr:lipid transfer-like protein VAS isoform X3 [Canna indica]